MIINTSEELRKLTGSWYESNHFSKIETDVILETEELAKVVGDELIEYAESLATKTPRTAEETELLERVQLPIALMAVFRYAQSNLVSHEGNGRTVKIDSDNEKMPWEWMLDRDDAAHIIKAQRATDRLIAYLEKKQISQWVNSPAKTAVKALFVNNTEVFGEYYPIDNSARFYFLATSLIREVQTVEVKKSLASDYAILLNAFQNNGLSDRQLELLDLTRRAIVLRTIALAVRRLNTQVLPMGVVKSMISASQTSNTSRPASVDEISYFAKRIDQDADKAIDEIKRWRHAEYADDLDYQLLPKNNPKGKFART